MGRAAHLVIRFFLGSRVPMRMANPLRTGPATPTPQLGPAGREVGDYATDAVPQMGRATRGLR